jgi:hypothetical protein
MQWIEHATIEELINISSTIKITIHDSIINGLSQNQTKCLCLGFLQSLTMYMKTWLRS